MDNNVKIFNLFNLIKYLNESMNYLDFLANTKENKEKKLYKSMIFSLKNMANVLLDILEKEIDLRDNYKIDEEVVNYIQQIQKELENKYDNEINN